jgi:glycyl-tRNA synthetase beta chain
MRWGGTSAFTWVRPLRRILCILDGETVPFSLRQGEDDGHGLASSHRTEGHRFLSPGAFGVTSAAQWRSELRGRHVIADAEERRERIASGIAEKAAELGLTVVPDDGLLAEVTGLVEWPVPLIGRIDPAFMDLPPEVMQVSMRVNQRYFALRDAEGRAAPYFAFATNIAASDGGTAIVAGNERVLRARFSDARHFWDLDRRTKLADRVPALDAVTFHAKLGSQGDRVRRLVQNAKAIADQINRYINRVGLEWPQLAPSQVEQAARLAKADLTTGMVGEFPELQGVIGGYYARHDGEDRVVYEAVRNHYAPRGVEDAVPTAPVTVAVALADKLDQIVSFFAVGEKPTGSGDPFALRRAALGIYRILHDNQLNLSLGGLLGLCGAGEHTEELVTFMKDRIRVQWRAEGHRHDILEAAFSDREDRIDDLARKVSALGHLLETDLGRQLLAGYRRANNILRIENIKDGPHAGPVDRGLLQDAAERSLDEWRGFSAEDVGRSIEERQYERAIAELAKLREPLDTFFDHVTVNSPQPELRRNRLRLLAAVVDTMNRVADFSKIEG